MIEFHTFKTTFRIVFNCMIYRLIPLITLFTSSLFAEENHLENTREEIMMNNLSCDVAVVGGGLAGLAAADRLKSKGLKVQVLEAESRAGGRVLTQHFPTGEHFELGAFCFGNAEQPLWDYIKRFDLPVIQQDRIDLSFWFKGHKGKINDKGSFLIGKEKEVSLSQLLNQFLPKLKQITTDVSFAEALVSVGASPEAIQWMQVNTLPGLFGDSFHEISTHAVIAFLEQYEDCTSFHAIKGGNDKLTKALADGLKEEVLYDCPVQKIVCLKDKCLLYAGTLEISAKRVIFAISLPDM